MQGPLALVGRILLSAIFVMAGVMKIPNFASTQEEMARHGMPVPAVFLVGAILVELGGGLSVLVGWKARWGALLLAMFLVPTTLIFHFDFSDAAQSAMFIKNAAIMGGLLYVAAYGPGWLSVDMWRALRQGA